MDTNKLKPFLRKILAYRRNKRAHFVLSKVITKPNMKILDIGCGPEGRSFEDFVPKDWNIIGVDIIDDQQVDMKHPNFSYVLQNAEDLRRFHDKKFDLVVSFGMLEHITDPDSYKKIVSEIIRVGKQYIVIVPFRYAIVEPHYGFPFFPILPYSVKVFLVKFFNLSNQRKVVKENPDFIKMRYRWLSNKEYKKDFPGSKIHIVPTLDTIAIVKKADEI